MSNIQQLANRLKEIEAGEKSSEFAKLLWKPKEGTQTVRIVPYKFNPENPFIELKFYYNLGGKTYLAPCTFGKPDPIQEVVEALRSSGSNEEKDIANTLRPTPRTYAPIIVRGKEEEGVKFWGFGITVYKQLLKLMTNAKYGDITSLTEGRDIDIEFHKESNKKNASGQSFPETTLLADPSVTPVVNPARKDLIDKIKDQTDITKIFPLKSYDELKAAVEQWLHPDAEATADTNSAVTQSPAAATPPTDATAGAAPSGPLGSEFEKFFDK